MAEKDSETTDQTEEKPADAPVEAAEVVQGSEDEHHDHHDDHAHYEEHYAEHEHHEERGASLSSRILTWLAVLVLGAVLAIWGGPRLAPLLPQWASPVVPYLLPGGDAAREEVAELRTDLETRLADINQPLDEEAIRSISAEAAQSAVAGLEAETADRIAALQDSVAASDSGDIEARLARVETQIDGLTAQLESMSKSLQMVGENGESLNENAVAQLAANEAALDGLKAELESLAARSGELSQRIDDVEAAATRRVAEAEAEAEKVAEAARNEQASAMYEANVAALGEAVAKGAPFADLIGVLQENPEVNVPEVLSNSAADGVATLDQLTEEFGPLAHEAIKVSMKAESEAGTVGRLGSFVKSQFATRSLEPVEGDSTDAVLSRMTGALNGGDLTVVLSEAEGLNDAAKGVLSAWIARVQERADVLAAIDAMVAKAS